MKKIFTYISLLCAALCFASVAGFAATDGDKKDTGVSLDKYVTGPDSDGIYTITLEAYATGESVTTITETHVPTDVMLVLDMSGSMDETMTSSWYTYQAQASKAYNRDNVGSSLYYLHTDGEYYQVQTTNEGGIGFLRTKKIYMYYIVDGQRYYLYGSGPGSTTKPSYVSSDSATIWTGVLYTRKSDSTSTSKIAALQTAVKSFIDIIAADASAYNVDHKIGVVKYADDSYYGSESSIAEGNHKNPDRYNYTEVVKQLTDVRTLTNVTALKNAVDVLDPAGATAADYGMNKAKYALGAAVAGRQQVVVMFTDGEPNHGSGFDDDVATTTVRKSKDLKDAGVIVYSVGIFQNPSNKVKQYMNAVSSNHPSAMSYNEAGVSTDIHGYFMNATDADELSEIFKSIAQETSSGGSSTTLDAESTVVLDVLTANFTLPYGSDTEHVGLFVEEVTAGEKHGEGEDAYYTYTFGNRTNLVPTGAQRSDYITISDVDETTGEQSIIVTGFDFTKADTESAFGNWVGPRTVRTSGHDETVYKGKRLVITIPITTVEGYEGGYDIATNTGDSGIYSGDEKIDDFPVPTLDFPSIAIVKTGLQAGESAIFEIQKTHTVDAEGNIDQAVTGAPKFRIVLTGDGENPQYAILKNIEEAEYTVTETKWSWAYTPNPSSYERVKVLFKNQVSEWPEGITEETGCVIFLFSNSEKTGTPSHAESMAVNKFKSDVSSTTSSQTVNSKNQPTE